jgi:hypothetical protein
LVAAAAATNPKPSTIHEGDDLIGEKEMTLKDSWVSFRRDYATGY